MPADGQAFVHQHAAARTGLRGSGRRHGDNCLPSVSRFARQEGPDCAPPRITAALGEVLVLDQVGRRQVLVSDRVVLAHQGERRLVGAVGACAADARVRLGEQHDCLAPALAAPRAARHPSLRPPQGHRRHAEAVWVGELAPIGACGKRLQPAINAGCLAREQQRLDWHLGAGAGNELATYQPSAARARVTVLGVPCSGRDQRTASRPIVATTRHPLTSRAPLPYSV
jgi:hypothetical protein